jgi:hypothetical protein
MSRSGNVWDDAAMESFFSSMKTERIGRKTYRTRNHAKADVFDYIERFYNPTRRHSTLGYLSPMDFERHAHVAEPDVGSWQNLSFDRTLGNGRKVSNYVIHLEDQQRGCGSSKEINQRPELGSREEAASDRDMGPARHKAAGRELLRG